MGAVKNLCKRGIVLDQGRVAFDGGVEDAASFYTMNNWSLSSNYQHFTNSCHRKGHSRELEYIDAKILNDVNNMSTEEPLELEVTFKRNNPNISKCQFGVIAKRTDDTPIWASYSPVQHISKEGTIFKAHISICHHNTSKGTYSLILNISLNNYTSEIRDYDIVDSSLSFEVNYVDHQHIQPFSTWRLNCNCSILSSEATIISNAP